MSINNTSPVKAAVDIAYLPPEKAGNKRIFPVPVEGAVSAGSMTANAIADDTIDATGTATFARLVAGSYTEQLAVGTSGTPVIVTTTSYVAGGTSQITSLTLTRGA